MGQKPIFGDDFPHHGTPNGYTNFGCRCDRCSAAVGEYRAQIRRANVKRLLALPDRGASNTSIKHGSASAYNGGRCRCEACTKAASAEKREGRKRALERNLAKYGGYMVETPDRKYKTAETPQPAFESVPFTGDLATREWFVENGYYTQRTFYGESRSFRESAARNMQEWGQLARTWNDALNDGPEFVDDSNWYSIKVLSFPEVFPLHVGDAIPDYEALQREKMARRRDELNGMAPVAKVVPAPAMSEPVVVERSEAETRQMIEDMARQNAERLAALDEDEWDDDVIPDGF